MKRQFTIHFSRECIDNAERNSCTKCIGVLGIVYSIKGAQHVMVDKDEIRFTHRGYRYIFTTPPQLTVVAKGLDDGRLMKRDIDPWVETIKDPTFVERSQHRRSKKTKRKIRSVTVKTPAKSRMSRWGGRRI